MNADLPEAAPPVVADTQVKPRRFAESALIVALSFLLGAGAVWLGHRFASTAVVDIGPTDTHYVSGFRDIERDGSVYFRWSAVPSSSVSIPVRFCGPGNVRLRVRRHFVDPATLVVSLGGSELGRRSVQARTNEPYEVIEFPVSKAACTSDASVLLESSVENDRPLGVAVDWVQFRSDSGFGSTNGTLLRGGLACALIAFMLLAAGAGAPLVSLSIAVLAMPLALTFEGNPATGERLLRGGIVALVLTAGLGLIIARLSGLLALSPRNRVRLVVITVAALAFRLAFLHPQAFYPDYRVHALVQQTYSNLGPSKFMDQLFEIQYARSLGLQQIDGNWYPFPYPPGPYFLIGLTQAVFGLDALDAAIVTAGVASAILPALTVALGLRLGLAPAVALGGAFFLALQPLLIRRVALGYFPGVIGQMFDALALLAAVALLSAQTGLARRTWALGALFLAAFLMYTQSIANFGLFIFTLLAFELIRRTFQAHGALRVAAAGLIALAAAVGAFYWRYSPVMDNIANHRSQPESRVLDRLDQLRQNAQPETAKTVDADENDPYAGTSLNPLRGLGRLGSRLWRFNGPFGVAILAGLWFLWRQSDAARKNLVLAWASVCLWISLLAAGLPSPNGFQHLKDLEFVSPLFALGLGLLGIRLRERARGLDWVFGAAWLAFAVRAYLAEFRERLLPLVGL